MCQALARPEQTQSQAIDLQAQRKIAFSKTGDTTLNIIRAALREAATAPTVFDALDVTGEALRRLADLAKAEASHA